MAGKLFRFALTCVFSGFIMHAAAQWTTNTFLNTSCTTLNGSVTPMVATTSQGQTYVSYYSPDSTGNYTLYLQLLDKDGNKLFGANGVTVCNKPSGTAVY